MENYGILVGLSSSFQLGVCYITSPLHATFKVVMIWYHELNISIQFINFNNTVMIRNLLRFSDFKKI